MAKPNRHNSNIYKSGLEEKFQTACEAKGWKLLYEKDRIKYVVPESNHTYTPDFTVTKNVYIETKGLWAAVDRKKALFIKEQHPEIQILYVLYRDQKLSKKSSTTYLEWAKKKELEACVFADTSTWTEHIKKHI